MPGESTLKVNVENQAFQTRELSEGVVDDVGVRCEEGTTPKINPHLHR